MSVTLNESQLKALGRLYRTYSIDKLTLTEHPGTNDWVIGNIIFTTGQEKRFVLNGDGGLVKDASNSTNTEHISV
jgi:hypothetical protein